MMSSQWRKHVEEDLLKKIKNRDRLINTLDKDKNKMEYNEFDLFKVQRWLLEAILKTPEKIIGKEIVITKLLQWEDI